MWSDLILEEIRQTREKHAAKFNYNLLEIYRDLKEQESKSNKLFVLYPAKRIQSCNHDERLVEV